MLVRTRWWRAQRRENHPRQHVRTGRSAGGKRKTSLRGDVLQRGAAPLAAGPGIGAGGQCATACCLVPEYPKREDAQPNKRNCWSKV